MSNISISIEIYEDIIQCAIAYRFVNRFQPKHINKQPVDCWIQTQPKIILTNRVCVLCNLFLLLPPVVVVASFFIHFFGEILYNSEIKYVVNEHYTHAKSDY